MKAATTPAVDLPADIVAPADAAGLSPLDYMLAVMRDRKADPLRRDRMAMAAAPFVHNRASEAAPGKRKSDEARATTAADGTDWETLLRPPAVQLGAP